VCLNILFITPNACICEQEMGERVRVRKICELSASRCGYSMIFQTLFHAFPPFHIYRNCLQFTLNSCVGFSLSISPFVFLRKSCIFKLKSSSERGCSLVSPNAAIILSPTFTLRQRNSSYEGIKIVADFCFFFLLNLKALVD